MIDLIMNDVVVTIPGWAIASLVLTAGLSVAVLSILGVLLLVIMRNELK